MALIDNLIAYWKLDETSGTRVDSHSNGLDLTDNNTVGSEAAVISNGALFASGSSEYLSHAGDALLRPSTNFTLQIWTRLDSTSGTYRVFAHNQGFFVSFGRRGTGSIELYNTNDAVGAYTGNVTGTSYQHVVVTYDGAGATDADKVKIYRNGVSQSLTFDAAFASSITYSGVLNIGRWNVFGGYFDGGADEMGYWSATKSGSDVTTLYNSGAGLAYPFNTSAIKTWNGVANASVKTWDGVARASVKTWNGIA